MLISQLARIDFRVDRVSSRKSNLRKLSFIPWKALTCLFSFVGSNQRQVEQFYLNKLRECCIICRTNEEMHRMYRPHASYQTLTNITNFVWLRKLSIYIHLNKSQKSPTVFQCEFHPHVPNRLISLEVLGIPGIWRRLSIWICIRNYDSFTKHHCAASEISSLIIVLVFECPR